MAAMLWCLSAQSSAAPTIPTTPPVPTASSGTTVIGEWEEDIGFYQGIRVVDALYTKQSKYQLIQVFNSQHYGKVLVLDGVLQLTEKDADSYNEMMAHIPMMQHKHPKRALVIGGGDGYVLSEVLKHDSLEHVDHVDLDGDVVRVCKEHFRWGSAWDDPRVRLHVADGASFARSAPTGFYDVIVQDSSDPWTWNEEGEVVPLPSGALYTRQHFAELHRILSPSGMLNFQAETFHITSDLEGICDWRHQALRVGFERVQYGTLFISSYPTGQIGFLLCEKNAAAASTQQEVEQRFAVLQTSQKSTTYYQPKLQRSAFDLPLWVERKLYESSTAATTTPTMGDDEDMPSLSDKTNSEL